MWCVRRYSYKHFQPTYSKLMEWTKIFSVSSLIIYDRLTLTRRMRFVCPQKKLGESPHVVSSTEFYSLTFSTIWGSVQMNVGGGRIFFTYPPLLSPPLAFLHSTEAAVTSCVDKEMMYICHPLKNTLLSLAMVVCLSLPPPSVALPTQCENMETYFGKHDQGGPQT